MAFTFMKWKSVQITNTAEEVKQRFLTGWYTFNSLENGKRAYSFSSAITKQQILFVRVTKRDGETTNYLNPFTFKLVFI